MKIYISRTLASYWNFQFENVLRPRIVVPICGHYVALQTRTFLLLKLQVHKTSGFDENGILGSLLDESKNVSTDSGILIVANMINHIAVCHDCSFNASQSIIWDMTVKILALNFSHITCVFCFLLRVSISSKLFFISDFHSKWIFSSLWSKTE